jgi:hypothetical protein
MLRSAASKVMWVGRATVFLVGLAVILAVLLGLASTAFGATGGNFILGRNNAADALTRLTANVNGSAMQIVNNTSPDANDTALHLRVQSGEAPMSVNSDGKVTDLNADQLDGQDSTAFSLAGHDHDSRYLGKTEKATDSELLDGKDSTQFVQGGGMAHRGALAIAPGTFPTIMETPEIRIAYSCPGSDIVSTNGILRIRNLGTTETVNLYSDNGGTNSNHIGTLAPNGTFDQFAAAGGEFVTFGVQGTFVATVQVFSVHRDSDNKCHVQAQALITKP